MGKSNLLRKFFILMWKTVLGKKRHWIGTLLEIIIPAVLFCALVALRTEGGAAFEPEPHNASIEATVFLPLQYCLGFQGNQLGLNSRNSSMYQLLYYPENEETKTLMTNLELRLNITLNPLCSSYSGGIFNITKSTFSVRPVSSIDEIETVTAASSVTGDSDTPIIYGGIIFESGPDDTNLKYTIRLAQEFTQQRTDLLYYPYTSDGPQAQNGDQYNFQSSLQAIIDLSFMEIKTGEKLLFSSDLRDKNPLQIILSITEELQNIKVLTGLQQMAYPAYVKNDLALILNFMLPLFLILSFAFIVPPVLKRIVYEKETGVKELMKMMGLPSWLHWIAWYINSAMTSAISILIIVALVSVSFKEGTGPVLEFSNPVCTFFFLFFYASALVTQLFALSTLFNRPNLALGLGVLFHVLTYFIPSNLINQTDDGYLSIPMESKMLMGLLPNINLVWGVKVLIELEGRGVGVQWDTLFVRTNPSDPLCMGWVWGMFIIDMAVYALLIWYLDNIRPGNYGVAQPWYFPFLPSTWISSTPSTIVPDDLEAKDLSMFEAEPNVEAGIRVRGLRKEFPKFRGDGVLAVDQVSFSAYHGEITTLLGHNGAGKTTTMSVLTGLYSPTAGRATINGFDISTNMSQVRESLGLCPQHNMLFEDLTVREHFVFFGMLKGLSKGKAEVESTKYIEMLNLIPKRNVIVTNLSGGMKRKVNLGIALIGDSKVVMLDEPTSGMDPEARRGMWDLLLSLKKTRTILLTTHFMEEADVLGDRIAIMARGKVQCCGTPFFLKRRFGSGYSLNVAKLKNRDSQAINKVVDTHVEGTSVLSESEEVLTIAIPSEQSSKFPDMFEELEKKSNSLGIEHLGISLTTMEDVFLKIGELSEHDDSKHALTAAASRTVQNGRNGHLQPRKLATGLKLYLNQLRGLLNKRMIYTYRRPILYIVMMLVPIGMALFNVLSLNAVETRRSNNPPLSLSLGAYTDPTTFIGTDNMSQDMAYIFGNNTARFGKTVYSPNVSESIITGVDGTEGMAVYKDSYIIAGEFNEVTELYILPDTPGLPWKGLFATGIYNSIPIHSKPLAQLELSNSVLGYLERNSQIKHSIEVTTHPLPESKQDEFENISSGQNTFAIFGYGIVIPIGLSILVSAFLIFPLNERATSAKQVQIMAGLSPGLFWLSNLLWDVLLYLLSALVMFGLILAVDTNETLTNHGAPGAFLLILVFLGFFGIPFSYAASFAFSTAAGGFSFLIIVNILAGSIASTAVYLLRLFGEVGSENLTLASDIVRWIFTWFPIFPFSRICDKKISKEILTAACSTAKESPALLQSPQIRNYLQCCMEYLVGEENVMCDVPLIVPITPSVTALNITIPCHTIKSFYTWDPLQGINTDLVMLVIDGVLLFALLVLIETRLLPRLIEKIKGMSIVSGCWYKIPETSYLLDDDVLDEQERVCKLRGEDLMTVINLQKKFRKLHAVQGLSFGIRQGECFGLLGINGAGKTTTFRMLTGDEAPTEGLAMLMGTSSTDRSKFLRNIGYCPQFDSIIPELTGRELLTLMCRIRGVPSESTKAEVQRWTDFLGIQEYINRESGSYSGGNKRKLNVAMSLVGEPPIIFLDEPSTGVDPVARRNLWNIIQGIQANGQAVVLTSHSMEECEALCDRLGIMVNGQFQCFGTVNHLKNKFAQGFTLLIKLTLAEEDIADLVEEEIIKKVRLAFVSASLKDRHRGYLQFQIEDPTIPLHQLFRKMEEIKSKEEFVEEYSIKETTLEQVFLSFAKKQLTTL
ncbi:retinal-specific ATP-binding cassette transporter [Eurytemora carolleeae]|uniref:retinal-specific ATP-binding cassette transporter n=1 Tax=Eurytemora carolleeae TaxID=1294199 RepID=UPI000C7711BA|nr:retinal-specific ATP-binding cassette transporter [Eurytemora carolleeae]|eukprot:XP_023336664.1 retinal-specific ATP-binding cassette transporter-like [Eurytemora affinis]